VDELPRVLGLRIAEAAPQLGDDQQGKEDRGEDGRAAQIAARERRGQTASSSTKAL
jgi:hypothetical protein